MHGRLLALQKGRPTLRASDGVGQGPGENFRRLIQPLLASLRSQAFLLPSFLKSKLFLPGIEEVWATSLKFPAAGAALAEAEDAESEAEPFALGTGAGPEASPMEAAVVALTQIVAHLAKQKKKAEKTPSLEAALDRAEGFSLLGEAGSSSSSGGGRSKAAAYRILKDTLTRGAFPHLRSH